MNQSNIVIATIKRVRAGSLPSRPRLAVSQEESLVRDARAGLRPAQLVENKLRCVLKSASVPLSQISSECCGGRDRR
jgi:hypothetical protein